MGLEEKHSWRLSIALGLLLVIASFLSLFIGVIDMTPGELFAGNAEQFQLFLISRLPRLLAILCTGMGMSVAGLIMQQLCMNKFVSPTTGATEVIMGGHAGMPWICPMSSNTGKNCCQNRSGKPILPGMPLLRTGSGKSARMCLMLPFW